MRKTKRRKPMAEINVVPYIDVTLVLLIIFMITTPMLQTGVEVDLPKADSKAVEQKETPPLIITITENHQYFVEINNGQPIPVESEGINEKVSEILNKNINTQVFIKAAEKIDYGSVVKVMASLKNTGIPNVGLMTESDDKQ
jgi:biopolymer transport protein TolR